MDTVDAHLRAALEGTPLKGTRLFLARFLWRVLYLADPRPVLERIAECANLATAATHEALAEFAKYRSMFMCVPLALVPASTMGLINKWASECGWSAVPQDLAVYHGALRAAETPVSD